MRTAARSPSMSLTTCPMGPFITSQNMSLGTCPYQTPSARGRHLERPAVGQRAEVAAAALGRAVARGREAVAVDAEDAVAVGVVGGRADHDRVVAGGHVGEAERAV